MLDRYADPNERLALMLCAAYSALVYLVLLITIVGIPYILGFAIFFAIAQGLAIGSLRGNGVRVTPTQFPMVYRFASEIARQMNFAQLPEIYVLQEGGMLNAFATRFFGRNFVVIYSDILELAMEEGEAEVAFVVAHEMAHLYRKHTIWKSFLYPAMLMPFLGVLYSRCCEYTADAIGTVCMPEGAVNGLLVLAAGKHLYKHVDPAAYVAQVEEAQNSFWTTFAELLHTHPNLPKRVLRTGQLLMKLPTGFRNSTDAVAVAGVLR